MTIHRDQPRCRHRPSGRGGDRGAYRRHRPAAASARAWIDSLSARAHQRSIRRARHRATPSAAVVW